MTVHNLNADITPIEHEFDFIGGDLCLDFANTVGGMPPESLSQERLITYPHLVAWSQQANLISADEAYVLLRKAHTAPLEATAILERARALRQAITGIFAALAYHQQPSESHLDLLNRELERGMAGPRLTITADGFEWEWRKDEGALDQMLAPVVRSAAALLTSTQHKWVRECANDLCHWLFVDTTKNHSRHWCRTSGCGNVMRVRKHRERQHPHE